MLRFRRSKACPTIYFNYYKRTLEWEEFFDFDESTVGMWVQLQRQLALENINFRCCYFRETPKDADLALLHYVDRTKDIERCFTHLPKERRMLIAYEPPPLEPITHAAETHTMFGTVFTWRKDLIDNRKFIAFRIPYNFKPMLPPKPFEQKKLLSFVYSNKTCDRPNELYTTRRHLVEYFERHGNEDFEFWGRGWNPEVYQNYRGEAANKIEVLSNYRFSIAYENSTGTDGYVTEKILDSFVAGSVPIYLGAPNITDYVPSDCFIDARRFESEAELHAFLKGVTPKEHQGYIERIKLYLASEQARLFSREENVRVLKNRMLQLLGK